VLDIGAGTGVLAFVAVLSGARRAAGLDIDVAAVEAARRNAARNRLAHGCRFTMTPVSKVKKRFDLVVANISLEPLASEAAAIGRAVVPGGFLLLTGILTGDRAELERRYAALGFRRVPVRSKKIEEGWALLSMRRVSASTRGR